MRMVDVDALARLIGPPPPGPFRIDWAAVEGALGLRLPTDFRRFAEAFGSIDLGDFVWIWSPAAGEVPFEPATQVFLRHSRDWDPSAYPYAFWPEPGGLLPWGSSRASDHFFWDTSVGADPERWPVVIHRYLSPAIGKNGEPTGGYTHTGPVWHRIDASMIEVVAALVSGDRFTAGVHLERGPLPGRYGPDKRGGVWYPPSATRRPVPASSAAVNGTLDRLRQPGTATADWSGIDVPPDYRALLEATGAGTVAGRLRLLAPSAPAGFDIAAEHVRAADRCGLPTAFAPAPGGVRLWGAFTTGETCWWVPAWYEPAGWPVLICAADGVGWQRLDITASEFVAQWLAGRMDLPVLAPEALPDTVSLQPADAGVPQPPPRSPRPRDPLALLATLLGPPDPPREADWSADEDALGARLPDDIKRLHAAYGPTPVERVSIAGPGTLARDHERYLPFAREFASYPMYPDPGGLLRWGSTEGRAGLWWDTTRPDPDTWTVVVDHSGTWQPYPGGLVDLLVAALTGRDHRLLRPTPSSPGARPR
jgi:hypothetical protein